MYNVIGEVSKRGRGKITMSNWDCSLSVGLRFFVRCGKITMSNWDVSLLPISKYFCFILRGKITMSNWDGMSMYARGWNIEWKNNYE